MSDFPDNDSLVTLSRVEHNVDAKSKRVVLRGQDSSTGDWVNIAAVDNGDGTFSLSTSATISGDVSLEQPSSPSVTSVNDTATSTTLISANADRLEVEVVNTSSAALFILKGSGTASSSNFTARLEQYDYYTTDYTGQINGVWASDPNDGAAIITEST